jgi:hypothetical protein
MKKRAKARSVSLGYLVQQFAVFVATVGLGFNRLFNRCLSVGWYKDKWSVLASGYQMGVASISIARKE